MSIAKSSLTTLTDLESLTRSREITDHHTRVHIGHYRTHWYLEYEYWSCGSMTFLGSTLFAILGGDDFLMAIFAQSGLVSRCDEDDMSTVTTITTKRSSLWDIFLTTPRDDTVTSFTCLESHFYFIDEHI